MLKPMAELAKLYMALVALEKVMISFESERSSLTTAVSMDKKGTREHMDRLTSSIPKHTHREHHQQLARSQGPTVLAIPLVSSTHSGA